MIKIDCKGYAQQILDKVRSVPNKKALLILTAGDDPASASYVRGKIKDCKECGIPYLHKKVENEYLLHKEIAKANTDSAIGGIIVQLPLPKGWDEDLAVGAVNIDKDVDGFRHNSPFKPCTPEGIVYLMKKELGKDLSGANILLIGKGKLVGKPLINLLLDEGCTLTISHSRTKHMDWLLLTHFDIIITAVGRPGLLDMEMIDTNMIIDAGISKGKDGKICGDCYNHENGDSWTKYTSVPGGVGLMTRAMLMAHVAGVDIESI